MGISDDETAEQAPGQVNDEPMIMMAVEHYARYRWVQAPIAALALWLIASPFTLGWSRPALAAPLIFWAPEAAPYANDRLAGALLILFGLMRPRPQARRAVGRG